MDRQAFMERVRRVLGDPGSSGPPVPPAVDEAVVRLVDRRSSLPDRFARRAEEVGMTVHRARAARLVEALAALLGDLKIGVATVSVADARIEAAVDQALERSGGRHVDHRTAPALQTHFDVDAGITDVDAAVAESGTLVLDTRSRSRGTHLVPPVHVAIVLASKLVPDLLDLWSKDGPTNGPDASLISLVTGPSKTADIEGILITGVHGPGQVHVVLVEGTEGLRD
jgi:L-lactate dehydrogenase complex protein LldG